MLLFEFVCHFNKIYVNKFIMIKTNKIERRPWTSKKYFVCKIYIIISVIILLNSFATLVRKTQRSGI